MCICLCVICCLILCCTLNVCYCALPFLLLFSSLYSFLCVCFLATVVVVKLNDDDDDVEMWSCCVANCSKTASASGQQLQSSTAAGTGSVSEECRAVGGLSSSWSHRSTPQMSGGRGGRGGGGGAVAHNTRPTGGLDRRLQQLRADVDDNDAMHRFK